MANPETSWADAERIVFDMLLTKTGATEGKNAWLGMLPPGVTNCWSLNTGGGDARSTWAGDGCYGSLRIGGEIRGRYQVRADAQKLASQLIDLLSEKKNFFHIKHLQWFRIASGGMPTVQSDTFVPANSQGKVRGCYIVTIGCEMIYNRSDEY